ncbi:MAG: FHA domain-containing protein [Bacteroidales bacterium]|nr:FHA domain-containing protein [Bacteroidales bacterium]
MKVITIGRSKDNNNVVIEDNKVSRSHLQIIKDDNGDYYVIDLDSTNGTFVNGTRITGKVQLHKGDIVVIGNTTLSWEAYFNKESAGSNEDGKKPGTSNKKLYIVIFSILICVLIGVIAVIVYNNKKDEQNKEVSFDRVTKTYSEETKEANEARKEAENKANRAEIEAEEANEKAAKAEQEVEKTKANAKKEVKAANKKADEAKEAAEKAQEEVIAANQKVADAEEAAAKAKADAEKEVLEANKKVADAEKAANEAKAEAEESEQLTEEFYELLSSINNVKIKSVCEDMKLKGKDKETLKSYFKNANNEGKKNVIESMKNIKNVKNMPEPTEEEIQIQQPSKTEHTPEQENENIEETQATNK